MYSTICLHFTKSNINATIILFNFLNCASVICLHTDRFFSVFGLRRPFSYGISKTWYPEDMYIYSKTSYSVHSVMWSVAMTTECTGSCQAAMMDMIWSVVMTILLHAEEVVKRRRWIDGKISLLSDLILTCCHYYVFSLLFVIIIAFCKYVLICRHTLYSSVHMLLNWKVSKTS